MILCPQTRKHVDPESCRQKRRENRTLGTIHRACVHCVVDLGVKKEIIPKGAVWQELRPLPIVPLPPPKFPRKRYLSFMGGMPNKERETAREWHRDGKAMTHSPAKPEGRATGKDAPRPIKPFWRPKYVGVLKPVPSRAGTVMRLPTRPGWVERGAGV